MRAKEAVLLLAVLTSPASAQKLEILTVNRANLEDSINIVSELETDIKVTHVKPSTIWKYQPKSLRLVADEKPKDYRALPKGKLCLLANLRSDPYRAVQPHVYFEVAGLPTHLSTKVAVGVLDKSVGLACGVFLGQYMRRVDDYGDVTFRAKQFEAGWHRGLYLLADRPEFTFFFSYSQEKTFEYFDTSLGLKVGKLLHAPPGLSGLGIEAQFESYLGAGGGLSYLTRNGRFGTSLCYLVPGLAEINRERMIGLIVENGVVLRLHVLWF